MQMQDSSNSSEMHDEPARLPVRPNAVVMQKAVIVIENGAK
jgi:hypothetical protein